MKSITRTQVRIPDDLITWLKEQAQQENRSMNGQLVHGLRKLRDIARGNQNEHA